MSKLRIPTAQDREVQNKAKMTDFAILLGGEANGEGYGSYWLQSENDAGSAIRIGEYGEIEETSVEDKKTGMRFIVDTKEFSSMRGKQGKEVVVAGEFPQSCVGKILQRKLNEAEEKGELKELQKRIAIYRTEKDISGNINIRKNNYVVYEYKGEKYIKYNVFFDVNDKLFLEGSKLLDGRKFKDGDSLWVKVEPIRWIRDEKGFLKSEKILYAGLHFDKKTEVSKDFSKTKMNEILNLFEKSIGIEKIVEDVKYIKRHDAKEAEEVASFAISKKGNFFEKYKGWLKAKLNNFLGR